MGTGTCPSTFPSEVDAHVPVRVESNAIPEISINQRFPNELTLGLDLGDRRHHYCALDASGVILMEDVMPNTRECLAQLSARFPAALFIMETGTLSPWVSRLLEQLGHRVIVANARKLAVTLLALWKNGADYEAQPTLTRAA